MNSPLIHFIARFLLTPILLCGIAMLIKGYGQTGGGFSGGLIAALGIMLQYVVFGRETVERNLPINTRIALLTAVIGLLLMLCTTFWPVLLASAPLSHWPPPGAELLHFGVLEVHTALVFETGIFLVVFGFVVAVIHVVAGGDML